LHGTKRALNEFWKERNRDVYKVGTRVIRVQTGQHYVISKIETKRADGSLFKKETRFHLKHERGPIDLTVSEDELKTLFSPIKQTNADRIRNMTDEELTAFLCNITSDDEGCDSCLAWKYCHKGHTGFEDWLKAESEEAEAKLKGVEEKESKDVSAWKNHIMNRFMREE